MISIQEALDLVRTHALKPETEELQLTRTRNRILAEDVLATLDSPPYSNSAMDGFAVRWDDVSPCASGETVQLKIAGESQAGAPFSGSIDSGQAIRISTGAIIPDKVDTVVPIEDCDVTGDQVQINSVRKPYQHVRYQGEEFKQGDTLVKAGAELGPGLIGLLASNGVSRVKVYGRCSVAIIITGKELVPFDQKADDHSLRDSNRPMLSSLVEQSGGELKYETQIDDELALTTQAIREAEQKAEIIFLSGGVSMGVHDHVKAAAGECGYTQVFWKVNQKPGKPLFFARKDKALLMGLPGNPVSAFMCFQHYGRPLLQTSMGGSFERQTLAAQLGEPVVNRSERGTMLRVTLKSRQGGLAEARPLEHQGSHMLTSIAAADGYIVIVGRQELPAGSAVDVYEF